MKTEKELLKVIQDSIQEYCDSRTICSECVLESFCDYCNYHGSFGLLTYIEKVIEESENEN